MKVLKLNKTHVQQILKLESKSAPQPPVYSPYDEKALKFIFNNSNTCKAIGLFDNNSLIGWGCYRTKYNKHTQDKGVFEISSIVIDKNYRRKGYGKKILKRLIKDIKLNQNYKKIILTVSPLNIGALILYLKNGFGVFDFKKNVYGPGEDRLLMQLK